MVARVILEPIMSILLETTIWHYGDKAASTSISLSKC